MLRLKSALIISPVTPCQADRLDSMEGGNCIPVERLVTCESMCGITVPHMPTGFSKGKLKNTHTSYTIQSMYASASRCVPMYSKVQAVGENMQTLIDLNICHMTQ